MYNEVVNRTSKLESIRELAEEQWGLVTRRQIENAQIPRTTIERLTTSGALLERVAHGVYRFAGSPIPDHLELRAAWLQLAPEIPAWQRSHEKGVVSHRSAAALYEIGHLPADLHEFTLQRRKQTRRRDVRLHKRPLDDNQWIQLRGLPATRPARIASDLLYSNEDPGAVAQIIADAIRRVFDYPGAIATSLSPHAKRFGLRSGDGLSLLHWLLEIVGGNETDQWMTEARNAVVHENFQRTPIPSLLEARPPS